MIEIFEFSFPWKEYEHDDESFFGESVFPALLFVMLYCDAL